MNFDKQKAMDELCEIKRRADELEKMINKPEFEVGSFGKFWDFEEEWSVCDYLTSIHESAINPYSNKFTNWKHFEPITEAILPPWIEHDRKGYLPHGVKTGDYVEHIAADGTSSIALAVELVWGNVTHYRIIKRAES